MNACLCLLAFFTDALRKDKRGFAWVLLRVKRKTREKNARRASRRRSEFCAWGVWGDAVPPQKRAASERANVIERARQAVRYGAYSVRERSEAHSLFLPKARFAETRKQPCNAVRIFVFACSRGKKNARRQARVLLRVKRKTREKNARRASRRRSESCA